MKHYNLDEIQPVFKECKEFLDGLVYAYRVQGIGVPKQLKNVREKVNNQIKQIEGK